VERIKCESQDTFEKEVEKMNKRTVNSAPYFELYELSELLQKEDSIELLKKGEDYPRCAKTLENISKTQTQNPTSTGVHIDACDLFSVIDR
jgi:hypothetical protein